MRMMLEVQNGTVHSRNSPIASTGSDMEDQEVRDPEADEQGEIQVITRELDRRPVELERQRRVRARRVVLEREGRDHAAKAVALEEAGDVTTDDRHDEKQQQHEHQRRDESQPVRSSASLGAGYGRSRSERGAQWREGACSVPAGPQAAQAALKSFQRLFMYAASSISVFQHEMLVTRSMNEPPSRTVPAFSIGTP